MLRRSVFVQPLVVVVVVVVIIIGSAGVPVWGAYERIRHANIDEHARTRNHTPHTHTYVTGTSIVSSERDRSIRMSR
jgi:hypothetical protein